MNWVRRRARCERAQLFERLRDRIGRDVNRANKHLGAQTFSIRDDTESDSFVVIHNRREVGVVFELINDRIDVDQYAKHAGPHRRSFKITWEWDADNRQCRHLIDNGSEHHELWEISKRALEDLFFDPR